MFRWREPDSAESTAHDRADPNAQKGTEGGQAQGRGCPATARRYLDVLEGDEKIAFEEAYGARVAKAYPKNAAGQTLFPFRRLFMVAQRKG